MVEIPKHPWEIAAHDITGQMGLPMDSKIRLLRQAAHSPASTHCTPHASHLSRQECQRLACNFAGGILRRGMRLEGCW
jgi:hypothetical protein